LSGLGFSKTDSGEVFYISDAEIIKYLIDQLEEYEDNMGSSNLGTYLSLIDGVVGSLVFEDPKIGIALAILTFLLQHHDDIVSDMKSEKINSFQEILDRVEDNPQILVITNHNTFSSETKTETYYVGDKAYTYTYTDDNYDCDIDLSVSSIASVSARAADNGFGTRFGYNGDPYGVISYGVNMEYVMSSIELYLKVNYPLFFIWNY